MKQNAFAQLRAAVAGRSAHAIVNAAEADGRTPGEAALQLINCGFAPGNQDEANWTAQYDGSAALRSEFPSLQAYVALRRYEQERS